MNPPSLFCETWKYSPLQRQALQEAFDLALPLADQLIGTARKLWQAQQDPETSMNGPRAQCNRMSLEMLSAANGLKFIIDPYRFEEIAWRHHLAGSRFRTDQDWTENYQHLDEELTRRASQS